MILLTNFFLLVPVYGMDEDYGYRFATSSRCLHREKTKNGHTLLKVIFCLGSCVESFDFDNGNLVPRVGYFYFSIPGRCEKSERSHGYEVVVIVFFQ